MEAKKVIRQAVKDLESGGLVFFKDSNKDLYEVRIWVSFETEINSAELCTANNHE